MAKNKTGRVNEDIKEALSSVLRRIKDPRIAGKMISVVRCDTTGDLRYCKVYLSVLGDDEEKKEVVKGLKSAAGWMRRELSGTVDLRYTPELIIELDDSIEHGAHISKILNDIMPKEDAK